MASILSNVLERQRARFRSDRIDSHNNIDEMEEVEPYVDSTTITSTTTNATAGGSNTTATVPSSTTTTTTTASVTATSRSATARPTSASTSTTTSISTSPQPRRRSRSSVVATDALGTTTSSTTSGTTTITDLESGNGLEQPQVPSVYSSARTSASTSPTSTTAGMVGLLSQQQQQHTTRTTLAELEEERELSRRRSSLCILLTSFVLFRLWVSAIQEGDFGLLLVCFMATSATARWISYNREREEELDRRIASFHLENNNTNNNTGGNGEFAMNNELRMLSFQAQLTLAIMESQRQMMQGGYGHPDGRDLGEGVSDAARSKWKKISFQSSSNNNDNNNSKTAGGGGYGSVSQKDNKNNNKVDDVDEPHCSICLCEYEHGEDIIQLPCGHLYHDECISSWTMHHTKCPLCNLDLESVVDAEATASGATARGGVAGARGGHLSSSSGVEELSEVV